MQLSTRYINDRFLPDKAIDLMDEAASRVRLESEGVSPNIKALEEKIAVLRKDKEAAIAKQDYETAAQLRDIEKKPSTSELVDWLRALVAGGVDPDRIAKEIPFAGVLLKKDKDLRSLQRALR